MSEAGRTGAVVSLGGLPLDRVHAALARIEPAARAFYAYDLGALLERARRFLSAVAPLGAMAAYALKANALPALLAPLAECGFGADAASLGELVAAEHAGFDARRRVLNGNGKTLEEARWIAAHGVHSVNADHIAELDLLERAAAERQAPLRAALRVNPDIATPGHPFVATGDEEAKFGVSAAEALEAWAARGRWPHLVLDGLHLHVGSQLLDPTPLERAFLLALELREEAARRGAPVTLINLGGGFGMDYSDAGAEFPLERHASWLAVRATGLGVEWVLEPGRWLVGPVGVLVSEVLWVKRRDGRRFVVLATGMNDLIRPALYGARHRIVPVRPRPGPVEPARVVGPVCESADVFLDEARLPPLEPGDLVAILDTGAYGASMASTYNGRGRLPELVVRDGQLVRARAGETPHDLLARTRADVLEV